MNWIAETVVIFVTAMVVIGGPAWWMGRKPRRPLERTTLLARLEEGVGRTELSRAGRLPVITPSWPVPCASETGQPYGPFPADTGPLLHLSEKAAANIALERDIKAMCAEAEAKIPPRWR